MLDHASRSTVFQSFKSMKEYYRNIIVGANGIVYAKGDVYLQLIGVDRDPPEDFRPVRSIVNDSIEFEVPRMREVMGIDNTTYFGITVDDDLFSFATAELMKFDSPIVSVYSSLTYKLLVILLDDGSLEVVNGNHSIVYPPDLTRSEIPEHVIMITPYYDELDNEYDEDYDISDPFGYVIITADNQIFITELAFDRNSDSWYLAKRDSVRSQYPIDYHDITVIRDGSLVMNDVIYTVDGQYSRHEDNVIFMLIRVDELPGIIDILPLDSGRMGILTDDGRLWMRTNGEISPIAQSIRALEPINLVSYYRNHVDYAKDIKNLYVQVNDGNVYSVDRNNVNDIGLPGDLLIEHRLKPAL